MIVLLYWVTYPSESDEDVGKCKGGFIVMGDLGESDENGEKYKYGLIIMGDLPR